MNVFLSNHIFWGGKRKRRRGGPFFFPPRSKDITFLFFKSNVGGLLACLLRACLELA